jgi:Neuraminidase (sialidase)
MLPLVWYWVLAQSQPAGYSLPVVDFAFDPSRVRVVDREAKQYLGHPTTVLLEDNRTILVVYPKGHGRGAIVLRRSTDAGRTWSAPQPVPGNWATSQETPTIHRVIDPAGRKRLIVFSGLYPIRRALSEDNGRTWTPLEPIGDFGGIVAMASVVRLRDGRYLAAFHDDGQYLKGTGQKGPFRVYVTESRDGGVTWSGPRAILQPAQAHWCEPGVVRSPDGKTLAMLLRENSRKFNSFVSFSRDEGETWSEPRELPGSLTGDRHVAAYAPDGRLFITFRDTTRQSPTKGDWVAWVGRWLDLEQGTPGQYRVRLQKNHQAEDCCYPGLERLRDGTFVTTTYGHWTPGEPPYIIVIRLKMKEIDAAYRRGQVVPR